MSSAMDNDSPGDSENVVCTQTIDEADGATDVSIIMSDIWDSDLHVTTLKDAEIFFHTKLLDALRIYLMRLPGMLEGSFHFFMSFLSNPLSLPSNLQSSLLSLLAEYVRWSPNSGIALRTPPQMHKHLLPFINLLVFSPIGDIKAQAYNLARAAMSNTGAFDNNLHEIVAWLLFIPGYDVVKSSVEAQEIGMLLSLSPVVISFLCDAVSTVANNLFKYWDIIRNHSSRLEKFKDASPDFSPLILCVLQKCVRVLNSESGTFTLAEKSMISLYVCSTLKYLLQTQEDASLLSALIRSVMFEGLQDHFFSAENSLDLYCEWRPVKNLLMFAESILNQETSYFFPIVRNNITADCSFTSTLGEVKKNMECTYDGGITGVTKAFCSAMICTTSDGLLENFPLVMAMSQQLQVPVSILASIMFLDQHFLDNIAKLWPDIFSAGLEMAASTSSSQGRKDDDLTEEIMPNVELGMDESVATVAFSLFLRRVPFHVLFPAIICTCFPCLVDSLKVEDLLLAKISEAPNDCLIYYLHLVLFWFYQIQSSCGFKSWDELSQHFEICYTLVKNVLAQFFAWKPDSEPSTSANFHLSAGNIQEVAKTIFSHPAVIKSLACPLNCSEVNEVDFVDSLEAFASASRQGVHSMDRLVLDLLTMTFDNILSSSSGQYSVLGEEDNASRQLVKVFNLFIQRLTLVLKEKLDLCIRTKVLSPILPTFYALHALIQYISPFKLLEVVHYIFGIVDVNCLTDQESYRVSLLSVGFCIAGDAFNNLSNYLLQPTAKRVPFYWKMEEKNFDTNLVEGVYLDACKFATKFEVDSAYDCLQKAVNAIYRQKRMQQGILHPLSLVLSRIILSTPIHILSHCIYRTSMTKASLLFLLVELSTLHCSVFGHLYLGILEKDCHHKGKNVEYKFASAFSDEKLLMLLPPALSYLNSIFATLEKQHYMRFTVIPDLYSKMLLNSFRHWKSFVSKIIFQENFGELLPSSVQELVSLVDGSLLGKAIHMLQYHFALTGYLRMEERLKLCNSIISSSCGNDELLDCDVDEMEIFSINKTLNLMNRVIAKISFCQMLLFGKDDQILYLPKETDEKLEDICLQRLSNKEDQSRIHFMKILVGTWQCIVKKFPLVSDCHKNNENPGCLLLYRYLELFILRTILELITEMRDGLIQFRSISFLEQLMRSSLLYRFEDPTTLKFLRTILTLLSEGKFSCTLFLQLLLSHSQFAPTICSVSKSHSFETGAFVRPISSILRSVVIPRPDGKSNLQRTDMEMKQLETVKLLRVLLHLTINENGSDFGKDTGINLKELYLLLLSSYGATLTEVDLEMYNVMCEIESIDKSISEDVAEMDNLWGIALLKLRQERLLDQKTSMADIEASEEQRRSQFRENFPVDPKTCVRTVLHFPYDRTVSDGPLLLNAQQQHNLGDIYEV
uniref:Uncharacterized protein LOC105115191 isoform X1 n=1 Tax=Rhizophora mucronata TaxID=61149 RepID=A0A2P2JYW9_RHIMU